MWYTNYIMDEYNVFNETPMTEKRARECNPQVLAFVGDAVHTLYIRTKLCEASTAKSNALHRMTASHVKASAQSEKIERIFDKLTEEEQYYYKRGRNAHTGATAKNATVVEYRKASGFEALLGYLYLTGKYERMKEILDLSEEE